MRRWLALAATMPLFAASGAEAQMKGLTSDSIAEVARNRVLDLRVSQERGVQGTLPLMRGMIVHHDFAPNAVLGIGLANLYAKRKSDSDMRVGERPSRSKKPALTFLFKF